LLKNKIDLGNSGWKPNINIQLPEILLSLKDSNDISDVENAISEMLDELIKPGIENEFLIGTRHETLIVSCLRDIELFLENLNDCVGYELSLKFLSSARDYLDQMIGFKTNDDMLDLLFGKFCIGK
jgi:tRNA U34 5-carboxymethylaminomethyl modifying GTPase MnmE/TrmE